MSSAQGSGSAAVPPVDVLEAAHEKLFAKAQRVADNPKWTGTLLVRAMRKLVNHRAALKAVAQDAQAGIRMVRAYRSGRYTELPTRTILSVVAALIYLVNPFDLISDLLPLIGLADDVALLSLVFASLRSDLDNFLGWERTHGKEGELIEGETIAARDD